MSAITSQETRVLAGPDDLATFNWAPGKWFFSPGGAVTGMTVFTPKGRVKAEWGDEIHEWCGLFFVGHIDTETARKAHASNRASLAPRCEDCGAFTDRDWHDEQLCRPGKGCRRTGRVVAP